MNESSAWRELGTSFAELEKDSSKDFNAEWSTAGDWLFTGVNDQSTFVSFKHAAERGAALLGCPAENLSPSFWLDEIKRQGSHYESGHIILPGSNGEPGEYEERGFIRRVCLASAELCYYLETRAIAGHRASADFCNALESRALKAKHATKIVVPDESDVPSCGREPRSTEPPDAPNGQLSSADPAPREKGERREQVNKFLEECNANSRVRVFRHHIWRLAGHSTARQFEYWQSSGAKATPEDDRNFNRILQMTPADFIVALKRKKLLK
jgi:hypothetical protein